MAPGEHDSTLMFGHDGSIPIRVGRIESTGIRVPNVFTAPTVRALDDGRLLVLGDDGMRPLALQVDWPCPGRPVESVTIRSIGRRAIELVQPGDVPGDQAQRRLTTSSQS